MPLRTRARIARIALATSAALLLTTAVFTAGVRTGEDRVLDIVCGLVDQSWSRDAVDCTTPKED